MNENDLPVTLLAEWAGGGALRWNVCGLASERPFTVEIDRVEQLKRAIAITNEELRAINRAIRRKRIPVSTRAATDFPGATIEADGPFSVPQVSFDFTKHNAGYNGTINLLKRIGFKIGNRDQNGRLLHALERLSRLVDSGKIVIVAQGFLYDLLLELIGNRPRFVVLRSGYGNADRMPVSFLRKPSRESILSWLCENSENAQEVGAIVLFGSGSFEPDIEAIRDSLDLKIFRVWLTTASEWQIEPLSSASNSDHNLPRISIVTVSFNQAAFLERTIESVLNQGYPNLEYVIVDGGSTDGSVEIIDRYREHFSAIVIEPDKGQSDALNKGFRLTSGEVMNWLCSDDLLEPGALHRIGRTYAVHKPDIIVGGCVRIGEERDMELARHHTSLILGETIPLDPFDILRFMKSWQRGHYFFQPEVFFSRRIWNAAGGFLKPHLFYAMDYDLWLRMALAGAKVRHIPSFLGCSRVHAAQKTQTNQHYLPQIAQIMREYRVLFERLLATLGPSHLG